MEKTAAIGYYYPVLEIKGLSKNFGKVSALSGVGFAVEKGTITGVLGPNGAGKSTLINILAGTLKPDEGDILYDGSSILRNRRRWRNGIGVVLEDLCLFEYLSIAEHLRLAGRLYGLGATEAEERKDSLLDFFDLEDVSATLLSEASQGMRKKTAIALSLLPSPEILILDEAFTGVDTVTAKYLRDLIKALSDRKITVLISSHILEAIEPLVDRCIVLDRGKILKDRRVSGDENLEEIYISALSSGAAAARELPWLF